MPELPETYRCIVVKSKGADFEQETRKLEAPKKGEVLIKVLACGVCHSDSIVTQGHMSVPYPMVPGHEIVGDVVAVGDGEQKWSVGDRVGSGWEGGHCFSCQDCRRGSFTTCANGTVNGIFRDGGYAEYVLCNTESVASVPTEIDPAVAAPLLCAGVTTFNSLRNIDHLHPGDVVAVQGVGGLGHLAIMFAKKMGYKVVALSSSDAKKDLAINKLGADLYLSRDDQVSGLQKLGGAKVIVCTADDPKIIAPLTEALATEGTLLMLAAGSGPVPINPLHLIMKKAMVKGWPSGSAMDSEDTLLFAHSQGVDCHIEKYDGKSLDQVKKAYESMISGKARFRAVLTFA